MDCKQRQLPKAGPKKIAELSRLASEELAQKMKLELEFIPTLNKYFRKIARDSKKYYIENQTIMPLSDARNEMTQILMDHYLNTASKFTQSLRGRDPSIKNHRFLKEAKMGIEKKQSVNPDDLINELFFSESVNRTVYESGLITDTTDKDLTAAYFEAESSSEGIGSAEWTAAIAATAAASFLEKSLSRVDTIAATETQYAAEDAKSKEANIVEFLLNFEGDIPVDPAVPFDPTELIDLSPISGDAIKYWITMADNLVRDAHVEAEGQVQFADEAFTVMNEELMYPRDTSLGASAGNVINCRCSAIYEIIE